MFPAPLKLFRRHESACSGGYPKDRRVYQHETIKTKRKGDRSIADCSCPIYAEGNVQRAGRKVYLRPRSTGVRDWEEAKEIAAAWSEWGGLEPPAAAPYTPPGGQLVTVEDAVSYFLTMKENQGIKDVNQYRQLLQQRLLPFCAAKGLRYVQEMDHAPFWHGFRASWVDLNPLKNRKPALGQSLPTVALSNPQTISRVINQTRHFVNVCVDNRWLSQNWASRKHGLKISTVVRQKEPFSREEMAAIYEATERVTDGHGWLVKRTGQANAKEILAFVLVARYTGLRVSSIVSMRSTQLVEFDHSVYRHAIYCNPAKTETTRQENFVFIPIPENLPGHPNVVAALKAVAAKRGGEYFFRGGTSENLSTQIGNWQRRLNRLFQLAGEILAAKGMKFAEKPTPHKFRHTFAATLLQEGMSLRAVAAFLGDTESTVRKHYAKFCVAEQRAAATDMAEAMRRFADRQREQQKSRMQLISG